MSARARDNHVVRIGTRGSTLALAQAKLVATALDEAGVDHEIVIVETAGDRRAPDTAWGEGAFVTAIERALVEERVDVAVHSAKDVPTDEDPRLAIAAFLPRAEPRDALVLPNGESGTLDRLPPGTVIGTDSPRRTGFLRAYRADVEVQPLHGNVDTRLRRLDDGEVGALLLAAAGLIRLGRGDRIAQLVPVDVVPPAPGQGAIAVQVRAHDKRTLEAVRAIDDVPTRVAVDAERAFLHATGGGCRAPIGALASVDADGLELVGGFASVDGTAVGLERIAGDVDERLELAQRLAERLVARRAHLPGSPRVLVTRPSQDSRRLAAHLANLGLGALVVPAIEIELIDASPEMDAHVERLDEFAWAVVTSANGARSVGAAARRLAVDLSKVRWAAVGNATVRELSRLGITDAWLPSQSNAATIARELPIQGGERILWVRGDLADEGLAQDLAARGTSVTSITAYRTIVAPASSRATLEDALSDGRVDAVILASPSAARGLVQLARDDNIGALLAVPAICVGERTAAAARELGFAVIGVAKTQDENALAELVAELMSGKTADRQMTGASA